jgi:hypothetical protein
VQSAAAHASKRGEKLKDTSMQVAFLAHPKHAYANLPCKLPFLNPL